MNLTRTNRVCYRATSRHQQTVVYLKSLRRRRENKLIVKCIEQYLSVPKIASPEARVFFYSCAQQKIGEEPGEEGAAGFWIL